MNKYEWGAINGVSNEEVDRIAYIKSMFNGKVALVYELEGDEWAKSYD